MDVHSGVNINGCAFMSHYQWVCIPESLSMGVHSGVIINGCVFRRHYQWVCIQESLSMGVHSGIIAMFSLLKYFLHTIYLYS